MLFLQTQKEVTFLAAVSVFRLSWTLFYHTVAGCHSSCDLSLEMLRESPGPGFQFRLYYSLGIWLWDFFKKKLQCASVSLKQAKDSTIFIGSNHVVEQSHIKLMPLTGTM